MPRTHAHVSQAGSLVARYAFEKNSGRAHETSLAHGLCKVVLVTNSASLRAQWNTATVLSIEQLQTNSDSIFSEAPPLLQVSRATALDFFGFSLAT